MFAADIRDVAEKPVSDAEIDDLYKEFLLEVELVQIEQKTLLRCLVKHHGLRRVFCEGLTRAAGSLPGGVSTRTVQG